MNNPLVWLAGVVIAAGAAAWFYWRAPVAPIAPAPPPVAATPNAVTPAEPPKILYPIADAPASATPLPSLAGSDELAAQTAAALVGRDAFARLVVPDELIRRIVVTVDNLPRKTVAQRLLPTRPVPGAFIVAGGDSALAIGDQNAFRYRPYVLALEAADARAWVAAYTKLYPLFQTAYRELGYPDTYFNDRLVAAIDDLLAAPDVAAPRLVQPKVLYQFADAGLEDRSAGQKLMIRMGPDNAARVKAKLATLRRELTGKPPGP